MYSSHDHTNAEPDFQRSHYGAERDAQNSHKQTISYLQACTVHNTKLTRQVEFTQPSEDVATDMYSSQNYTTETPHTCTAYTTMQFLD